MNGVSFETSRRLSVIGCLSLALAMFFLCLMPVFLFDTMRAALIRLHLSPTVAVLSVLGIFLGSLVNIPLYRIRREEAQLVEHLAVLVERERSTGLSYQVCWQLCLRERRRCHHMDAGTREKLVF